MTAIGDLITISDDAGVHTFDAKVVAVRSEDDFDVVPVDPGMRIYADSLRVDVITTQ